MIFSSYIFIFYFLPLALSGYYLLARGNWKLLLLPPAKVARPPVQLVTRPAAPSAINLR